MKNIENTTLKELIKYCRNNNIKGFSNKNKQKLIDLIKNSETTNEDNSEITNEDNSEITNEDNSEITNEDNSETTNEDNIEITIENKEGLEFLKKIKDNTIDLVLTDPPYITSRESGMNKHYNIIELNKKNNIKNVKTEKEWDIFVKSFNKDFILTDKHKDDFIKYGSPYGKKYAVKTDYGEWDKNFTIEILEEFIKEYYNKLRSGGTLIIFFDIWKISTLKDIMEKYKFKQLRFIEWIKTNPQPLNSKTNYLTNCREIALVGVKKGKPTFNSKYDNGIYKYPLQGGKNRFHPTQKSLKLFEELIKKHTNNGDIVMDTFLGSGTTAIACKNLDRNFIGCEISKEYYDKIIELVE